ncbi:MAG: hypothetical protein K2I77_05075, partial [Anaeroplasmataceae bacterium]|nr:hypothetical protein [Anaeroplasmataceae bacterium]
RYYVHEWCRWLNGDNVAYLDTENINGMNLFSYCGNNPITGYDPNGNAWYHIFAWVLAAILVVAAGAAVMFFSGGSAMVALSAIMSASVGVASSTMGLTVSSFAFVGATLGFIGTSMWASRSGNMLEAGPEVLFSTALGGSFGGYGGYLSYNEQIGSPNNCGLMSNYDRRKQRQAYLNSINWSKEEAKGYEMSHPYGVYGNNRNYYELISSSEHRQFHKMYGYKTNDGQFIRKNPNFHNIWEWLFKWL